MIYRGEYQPLANILKKRKVNLLHVYFGHTGVHLLAFLKMWEGPAIVSFHGMDVQTRENQPDYINRLREMLQLLPIFMVRSNSLKERLVALGCEPKKIHLNHTSIPTQAFPYIKRDMPTHNTWHIVQACRLIEKKGLEHSLKAVAKLAEIYPNIKFVIAGEGKLLDHLVKLAFALGIKNIVTFTGFLNQQQLLDLYTNSHIFLHPSHVTEDQNQEGIPNSMLEAMSTGLPVVATYHGGIPEVVEDSVSGFLSPEGDVEKLYENLHRIISEPELMLKMGKNASDYISANFSKESSINKLEAIYDLAIESFEKKKS